MKKGLIACLPIGGLAASGMVIGFCAGGYYGGYLGKHSGHGLGDLGYLFEGALIGVVAGICVAAWGLRRWSAPQRLLALGWASLAGIVAAGSTWIKVNYNGW